MSSVDRADAEPHQASGHRNGAPAIFRDADLMLLRKCARFAKNTIRRDLGGDLVPIGRRSCSGSQIRASAHRSLQADPRRAGGGAFSILQGQRVASWSVSLEKAVYDERSRKRA